MNKKTLKIIIAVIFTLAIICISKSIQANSISSIDMDIYVDENGDAEVTEKWTCSTNSGTEVYHPYYNLGNSQITNIAVSEDSNNYQTLSSWDTSGSLSKKAYKCGINKISNGVELCWGISKYGSHVYTVKYNISKFVSELTDSQMIYWTLIPYDFSNAIGSVKIKIHSDSDIKDSVDVWGYGNYGGLAYVDNGAIYMQSDGRLATSEYMTILVKFPTGTYNTTNKLNKDFEYYYKMAEEGSVKYNKKSNSVTGKNIGTFIKTILYFIFYFLPIILLVFTKKMTTVGGFKYGKEKNKIKGDIQYYRDIPCNGDIFRTYFIAYYYGIMKNKTDLLGAIILKWLKEGIVKTEKVEVGRFRKRMDTAIILNDKEKTFADSREEKLYRMLYEASGDGVLEKKEFEKWCSGKYSRVLNWFDDIIKQEGKNLVIEGNMIKTKKTYIKIIKVGEYQVTEALTQEAIKLEGLKKYLKEYTLIDHREAIEVALFENYLVYAQLMGIAKEVAKEFKDLYPEIIEESHFNSYDNILFIHSCSTSGITAANSAKQAAQRYSGGGGGFSSGGGGGGSFGGGGGRRRIPLKLNIKILNLGSENF